MCPALYHAKTAKVSVARTSKPPKVVWRVMMQLKNLTLNKNPKAPRCKSEDDTDHCIFCCFKNGHLLINICKIHFAVKISMDIRAKLFSFIFYGCHDLETLKINQVKSIRCSVV